MDNKTLIKDEFAHSLSTQTRILVIASAVLIIISIIFKQLDIAAAGTFSKLAFLLPFAGVMHCLRTATRSFLFRSALTKEFDRSQVFTGCLFSVKSLLLTVVAVTCLATLSSSATPISTTVGICAVKAVSASLDFALFSSLVYLAFIVGSDIGAFIIPILPFMTLFTPKIIQDYLRIGYGSHRFSSEITSVQSAFDNLGGSIHIIEMIAFISAILIITRNSFCNKDL